MIKYEWVEAPLAGAVTPERATAMVEKWLGRGLCRGCAYWGGCNSLDADTPPSEVGLCGCPKLSPKRKDQRGTLFPDGLLSDEGLWPGPMFGCVHWKRRR